MFGLHRNTKDMISLESSRFNRGSAIFGNESPVQLVELAPFFIDTYPVRNFEFAKFIEANGYSKEELWTTKGWEFIQERKIYQPNY